MRLLKETIQGSEYLAMGKPIIATKTMEMFKIMFTRFYKGGI
jgi:hypothetical protein